MAKKDKSKDEGKGKGGKTKRVVFKKSDFEKFAKKLGKFGDSLSPEERALLMVVLDKGGVSARSSGKDPIQTTSTVSVKMEVAEFDLGQFIVELLLALEGISAEVDDDGPSWVEEVTATTK